MSYDDFKKQVVQAYSNLLIVQYHDKPKAAATIKMHAEMLLGDMIIWKLRDLCLNVDKSVGKQLDQIGQWVGVDRFINSSRYEGKMWLAYIDWLEEEEPNNLQGGLQDWNDIQPSTDGPILAYEDIISSKRRLTDDIFRILIKLKIIKNEIVHSPKYIDDAIFDLFNQDVYIQWGRCLEMTYFYKSNKASIMDIALDKGVLPHPSGVNLKIKEIEYGEIA